MAFDASSGRIAQEFWTRWLRGANARTFSAKLIACRRGDIAGGDDRRADRPAVARHFVEALRGFFEWAVEANLLRAEPCPTLPPQR
jgi:hypothetical protein